MAWNTTQATSSLAVERELRARAEQKEAEEREERVAANAQLLALQQAHAAEVEGMRVGSGGPGSIGGGGRCRLGWLQRQAHGRMDP